MRAESPEHAVYNVSFGGPRTNLDTTRAMLALARADESLVERVKDRPGHDRRYAPDSTRLREELGWRPEVDFEKGLRLTADWYASNRAWWERVKSGEYREYYERMYGSRGKG
jgi:dTDP-glucose 4,6-dehydratase